MHDAGDAPGVPISSGIPPIVMWTGIIGVVLIFVMSGLVLSQSGNGHVWPADDTLTIKLS